MLLLNEGYFFVDTNINAKFIYVVLFKLSGFRGQFNGQVERDLFSMVF